jgi:mRNA-degrading endonuclease toxin of MazEF toxin-antitoxin module
MNYSRGDVVIVAFPFVLPEGQGTQKGRPAVVISDMTLDRRYKDLILASITSRIPHDLKETELVLEASAENGLAKRSVVRLEFLMTVPLEFVSRKIGRLSPEQMAGVDHKTARSLGLSR